MDRLARKARATGTDWALGIEARSRALLSEGDLAEGHFREAIDHLDRTRVRVDLARAHLLYGEWLRREHRRVDARAELRAALDEFRSIGMQAFAERARAELVATGEKVPKRTVETRDELTAQERQIARACPRRPVEPGDRRAAVPQSSNRGVAPAQGVRQARDPLPPGTPPRTWWAGGELTVA